MKLLPVHCCCTPAIRLGYLEVPDDQAHPGPARFYTRPEFQLEAPGPESGAGRQGPSGVIHTEIGWLSSGTLTLAVKSAHLGVEVWQRVPGFRLEP